MSAPRRGGWIGELARATEAARSRRRALAGVLLLLPLAGWLCIKGQQAGWYGFEAGIALIVAAAVLTIAALLAYGAGIGNAAEEKERSYAQRLNILHEVDRGLIANQAPQEIVEAALRPLRELLEAPRAIVNLLDLENGEVECLAAILGDLDSLRRGEPRIIDTEALPPSAHKDALLASAVRVYMAVPMVFGTELIGALSFGKETADFHPEHVEIAREVASQLAIAVAQTRLHARVRGHAAKLEESVAARTAELQDRTAELELANKELEAFSYTVSHDLRAPLRAVDGFARIFEEDYGRYVDQEGRRLIGVIRDSSRRMGALIDDLLAFSMLGRQVLHLQMVDMTQLAAEAWVELDADRKLTCSLPPLPAARGDRGLLKQVWANLLANAIKYSSKRNDARIEVAGSTQGGENVYCVSDNGAGFDMRYYGKLFGVFQRLHAAAEYTGTGVGLATVQRIVVRHGGRVWAEGEPERGARFYFSLPRRET
jgi:signal transduction histidine kinase